ncbi:MAG: gamma-glutamylcyclotransferase [Alphaproteobacteria bacterium]|nr:gamma-glutamylcyclotransferase [Alphaproteobacteria bacterium]MBT5860271.1 gamma-glutamylcyclotransferase [Alphaproteobacteria bacterium]
MKYFAFGSNMLTERLRARCPSAHPIGKGYAEGYRVRFSKRSEDGSGKATLVRASGHNAFGVLFTIAAPDVVALDKAEGTGYLRDDLFEITQFPLGHSLTAATYHARPKAMDDGLQPYDWYQDLVVAGARQHALPGDYIDMLASVSAQPDPDPRRHGRVEIDRILGRGWD